MRPLDLAWHQLLDCGKPTLSLQEIKAAWMAAYAQSVSNVSQPQAEEAPQTFNPHSAVNPLTVPSAESQPAPVDAGTRDATECRGAHRREAFVATYLGTPAHRGGARRLIGAVHVPLRAVALEGCAIAACRRHEEKEFEQGAGPSLPDRADEREAVTMGPRSTTRPLAP